MSKRATKQSLTARQREWLRHLRAIERSGKPIKDYAAEQGLPVQALYQAAKRLRELGMLAPSGRRVAKRKGFVKVAVTPASAARGEVAWRVRLPNGTTLESTLPLSAEAMVDLVERLGQAG
ncbi:MAG: hypothetical protein OEN00_17110 [Gemmatimonadota bacterium]|nr:hypothetical protein [Gemmatimonadota bacterium]